MLESKMQNIKSLISSLTNFFNEDKEAKKKIYIDKLEQILDLTTKVFQKCDKEKIYKYSYYDQTLKETIEIILNLSSDNYKWQLKTNKGINSYIISRELSEYCWENQMDIKNLILNLFEYINTIFSKKQQLVKAEKDKYNSEINCLDEAIKNLQELADTDISGEIKNK